MQAISEIAPPPESVAENKSGTISRNGIRNALVRNSRAG